MTPDKTRTSTASKAEGLDALGAQLLRLAAVGLLAGRIERHRSELDLVLGMFADVPLDRQPAALIDLVGDAVHRLGQSNEAAGNSLAAMYGTAPGERGLPYPDRHVRAADAWQGGMTLGTFDRRHRHGLIRVLEIEMLGLLRDAAVLSLRQYLNQDPGLRPLPDALDKPNLAFKRLHVRARTYLTDARRPAICTDWVYNDIATRGDQREFYISTKVEARVEIEALTPETIRPVQPLGINKYGYQVWRMQFVEMPARGQEIEWAIRKHFREPRHEALERDWLSIAVSQPRPIESGTFEVDLSLAKERPARFVKFVTPKQTLPVLRGSAGAVDTERAGVIGVNFESLVPWHSHGIYWWWQ